MIVTHGLTHLSLAVRDPERSLAFYAEVFGAEEHYRNETSIQVKGPGMHDILAFELDTSEAGRTGGIRHFGFRLTDPEHMDDAVDTVISAGGTLLRRGELAPGYPYAYVADPDGYEIELWFE